MEDFAKAIWNGIPTVVSARPEPDQRFEELATAPKISVNDAMEVAINIFHSLHLNTVAEDTKDFAETFTVETEDDDKLSWEWLVEYVPQIVKEYCGEAVVCDEPFLQELASCLLDDATFELLPLEKVLTHSKAVKVETLYTSYVDIATYPEHHEVYDIMWNELLVNEDDLSIDFDTFCRWFRLMYRKLFTNATFDRSNLAAKPHWLDAVSVTGDFRFPQFLETAKRLCRLYVKPASDCDTFYESTIHEAQEKMIQEDEVSNIYDVVLRPNKERLLVDPGEWHVLDNLDHLSEEKEFWKQSTKNRILVTGNATVGKTSLAECLAKKLNIAFLDTWTLAVEACRTDEDELGQELKQCVAKDEPIPFSLQASLLRRKLHHPSTEHRGYVLGDIPNCPSGDYEECEAFVDELEITDIPQYVVKVICPNDVYEDWLSTTYRKIEDEYEHELHLRREEAEAIKLAAEKKEAKEERKRRREEREERKAKIEAGEIQATEEDAEEIPDEPEEEEEAPPVDEEGNPLEPEAIQALELKKQKSVEERKFLAELKKLLYFSRKIDDLDQKDQRTLTGIEDYVNICKEREHAAKVGCFEETEKQAEFVIAKFGLLPSAAPYEPELPPEAIEGVEPGIDGDTTIGEAKLRALQEAGASFSNWLRYCPVTWYEQHVLVEGALCFALCYRNFIYCFASKDAMNRFRDSPHKFLLKEVDGFVPLTLMKRHPNVFANANISENDLEKKLAQRLKLTLAKLSDFHGKWVQHAEEVGRRNDIAAQRIAKDKKSKEEREERRKKKEKEAEAKKKKAAGAKPKSKKAKKDEEKEAEEQREREAAEAAEAARREAEQAQAQEDAPAAVQTTEDKIKESINRHLSRKQIFLPQLVSCLDDISEEKIMDLLSRLVLPETVIFFENKAPPVPHEDGELPPDEDEIEDEEPQEEEEPQPTDEVDENGEPIVAAPKAKPPKPFDPMDEKQYRRLTKKLLQKFAQIAEDAANNAEENAAPKQNIVVHRVNLYHRSIDEVVSDVLQIVCPVALQAYPPQEGEELVVDPEIDPDDPDAPKIDPRLIPGKKAANQYGVVAKYCPCTLRDAGYLLLGDPQFWLSLNGERYLFASQEALDRFKANPLRYIPSLPPTIPPPRIWILGVTSSGKHTLGTTLSSRFDVPLFFLEDSFFEEVLAAASSKSGKTVKGGTFVPASDPSESKYLRRAMDIVEELRAFEENQKKQTELKDETQKAQADREALRDEGEEVEDLDEEEEAEIAKILEFEPEEEEAQAERLGKAQRQIAAALMRVEPFESKGYILLEHPKTEIEFQQLMDEEAFPEIVVSLKLSVEVFLSRRADEEFKKRETEWKEKTDEIIKKRKELQLKAREVELEKWRRRNIGADDEPAAEEEEPPEDLEPVLMETVKADLEGIHDTETSNVASIVGMLPEKRIGFVEVNGDWGKEAVVSHTVELLGPNLARRRSLFEAPYVVPFDDAITMLNKGHKFLSAFGKVDPVALYDERSGIPQSYAFAKPGRTIAEEEEIPVLPPPPPKVKPKRIVKQMNDDGEEVEVEEDDPDAEEEPEQPQEEEEELEPEPEVSPDELEEMQKELDAKQKVIADAKKLRACVLKNRVYFFKNNDNLLRFLDHPLFFWDQQPPLKPVTSIVAVFEDADEDPNRRSMAHHIAKNTGLIYFDLPKILKWCLRIPHLPKYFEQAQQSLLSGERLDAELFANALTCRLLCGDVQLKGAVLFNLPRNVKQFMKMVQAKLLIHKLFDFADIEDPIIPMINNVARVSRKVSAPKMSLAALVDSVTSTLDSAKRRQELNMRRQLAFPAPIFDTSIPESDIQATLSVFKWYCPFLWTRSQMLVAADEERRYSAEYRGEVYCFSSDEYLMQFLVQPQTFSGEEPPVPAPLPTVLPTQVPASAMTKQLRFCGCCPVTLYETRERQGLKGVTEPLAVKGSPEFCVEYDNEFYSMLDNRTLELFLRQPWVYAKGAVLPDASKLPFDESILSTEVPETYITHALYEDVARAMLAVDATRPKFPGLSTEESALKFVALYLKAHNKKNNEYRDPCFKENFEKFKERSTLYKTITTDAPDDPEELEKFNHRCEVWDDAQDNPQCYTEYIKLKGPEKAE